VSEKAKIEIQKIVNINQIIILVLYQNLSAKTHQGICHIEDIINQEEITVEISIRFSPIKII